MAQAAGEQAALRAALRSTQACAVLVEQSTGRVAACFGNVDRAATPGSVLKPLLLASALRQNLVAPATTVFCTRDLRIGQQRYPCTHPQSGVAFNAQEALAYSCNTWFVALALRLPPPVLVAALRGYGLQPAEQPATQAQRQLLMLGLAGLRCSPRQVALAYRQLGGVLGQPFAGPVAQGLRDSVAFGMSHHAATAGMVVAGKTGTASDPPRQAWSHGWFAGFATPQHMPLVLSLFLPQGSGADAAQLAGVVFAQLAGEVR